jgi:SNF family Na+-dependent transporter
MAGLSTALFVGWWLAPAASRQAADLDRSVLGSAWLWLLRVGVPATIAVILMRSLALL